jgi:hypothetical protein
MQWLRAIQAAPCGRKSLPVRPVGLKGFYVFSVRLDTEGTYSLEGSTR